MPRTPNLPISPTSSGKWKYDLPDTLSPTGKRQRKTFATKKLAEISRQADLERHKLYGIEGHTLKASQATDAARALEVLEPYEATLTEAAKFYSDWRKQQLGSRMFAEVWQERIEAMTGLSDAHVRKAEQVRNKLLPKFGNRLVCNINHDELRSALNNAYPTAHGFNLALRMIAPAFKLSMIEGWISENPCDRIQKKQTGRHEIRILTLNQCRKVMMSAIDYRQKKDFPEFLRVDARGAMPALALMLFAGVRPGGEISRLTWNDIDLKAGTCFVSNKKAKTDRSRHFTLPDACIAWLELTPLTERIGGITPPNWKKCWQAVRRNAGISDLQDGLRKTFASCHLQHFNDVKATRSILGHEQGDVLFTNYRGLIKPTDAALFWGILPSGSEIAVVA